MAFHTRRFHPQISCKLAVVQKGDTRRTGLFWLFYELNRLMGRLPPDKPFKIFEFHMQKLLKRLFARPYGQRGPKSRKPGPHFRACAFIIGNLQLHKNELKNWGRSEPAGAPTAQGLQWVLKFFRGLYFRNFSAAKNHGIMKSCRTTLGSRPFAKSQDEAK